MNNLAAFHIAYRGGESERAAQEWKIYPYNENVFCSRRILFCFSYFARSSSKAKFTTMCSQCNEQPPLTQQCNSVEVPGNADPVADVVAPQRTSDDVYVCVLVALIEYRCNLIVQQSYHYKHVALCCTSCVGVAESL